ncbi:MAG: threonine synthase, partial [Dehalococcoidia bacterium]|nr:threonine synthase [Dehalococcoidia bacterium]
MNRATLQCISCGHREPVNAPRYQCPRCQDLFDVVYDLPPIDPEALKRLWDQRLTSPNPIDRSGVWRYRELLPFY